MDVPTATSEPFAELADVAQAFHGELDLEQLLPLIVTAARRITGAEYGALGVLGEDSDLIVQFVHQGIDAATVRQIGRTPTGGGLLGELIRRQELVVTDDLASHPASAGFPEHHPPMRHFLGLPVRAGNTVFGNLYLTEKPGGFTQFDVDVTTVLAAQAGMAIQAARLAERARIGAIQDERDRISRDLHDSVIQSLFSVGMALESAWPLIRTHPDEVQARIDTSIDQIDSAIRDIRTVIYTLRGETSGKLSLRRGLIELAEEFRSGGHTAPSLDIGSRLDQLVAPELVPDVLHIVREALSNAMRHADAESVSVKATVDGELLIVEVNDSGRGFRKDAVVLGHGLGNMAERAAILGADLTLDSRPSAGTSVALRVPLPRAGV
ncbi:GAF domain-containing sensor histidine kinase [Euzebya tangerina]|uniref:GAF domain-containing sensor histidine kinase n=1 Tax=Euzebya tangerina TaxID=591198 RepID=UPI000E30E05D|nr:GAF domain-containing sensor histidine kinase [Euzebya tangerina]